MHVSVITLFPEMFSPLRFSIPGRALEKGLWKLDLVGLRDFGIGPRKNVDAPCYSGGPGMLLRPDVVHDAVLHACTLSVKKPRFIYLSGRGTPVTQKELHMYAQDPYLNVLSGRYEGVDERVLEHWEFEQKRIGDFIVSGGEFPALMLIDGCVRCIPEALGNKDSLTQDSFQNGYLEHPQYTRPECWMGHEVPLVLRSGHHAHIKAWKEDNSFPLIP